MADKGFQFAPAEAAWAEVARLRGLLARLERAGALAGWPACPACTVRFSSKDTKHFPGCWLAKELGR